MRLSFDHIVSFFLAAVLHLLVLLFAAHFVSRQDETATVPELEVSSVELAVEGPSPDASATPAVSAPVPPGPAQPKPPPPMPESFPPPLPDPPSVPEPVAISPPLPSVTEPSHAPVAELPEPPPPAPSQQPQQSEPSPEPPDREETPPRTAPAPAATLEAGGGASGRIDAHPSLARPIRPNYPIGARRRGEEGSVILDVTVGADGRAADVRLVTSSGFPELDRAAERAAGQARFKPGKRNGKPAESVARLTLIFRLRDL